jgi:hypothetical protein
MVRRPAENVIVTTREGSPRSERFEARMPITRGSGPILTITLRDSSRKIGQERIAALTLDEIEALRDLLNTYFPKDAGCPLCASDQPCNRNHS